MVNYKSTALDDVFFSLSDATRRGIVLHLRSGPKSAHELARPYAVSLPAISKHLKVLERSHLIRRTIRGKYHTFTLNPKALKQAEDWLAFHEQYWEGSLKRLGTFLNKTKKRPL